MKAEEKPELLKKPWTRAKTRKVCCSDEFNRNIPRESGIHVAGTNNRTVSHRSYQRISWRQHQRKLFRWNEPGMQSGNSYGIGRTHTRNVPRPTNIRNIPRCLERLPSKRHKTTCKFQLGMEDCFLEKNSSAFHVILYK